MRSLLLSVFLGVGALSLGTGTLFADPAERAPATLRVTLPADAKLTIDGHATWSTSADRVFVSPPLESGKSYHYTLKAEFVRAGKTLSVAEDVTVRAGRETFVSLDVPALALGGYYLPSGSRYWYGADSDTRGYYEAPESATPTWAAPYLVPFTRSEEFAPRGGRSSESGFRENRWGNDSRDPFYHGEW